MIPKEKTGLEKEAFDWATKGVFDLLFPESQKQAAAKGYMGGVLAEREACAQIAESLHSGKEIAANADLMAGLIRGRSTAHTEL